MSGISDGSVGPFTPPLEALREGHPREMIIRAAAMRRRQNPAYEGAGLKKSHSMLFFGTCIRETSPSEARSPEPKQGHNEKIKERTMNEICRHFERTI